MYNRYNKDIIFKLKMSIFNASRKRIEPDTYLWAATQKEPCKKLGSHGLHTVLSQKLILPLRSYLKVHKCCYTKIYYSPKTETYLMCNRITKSTMNACHQELLSEYEISQDTSAGNWEGQCKELPRTCSPRMRCVGGGSCVLPTTSP
jgi:hypothetical protein